MRTTGRKDKLKYFFKNRDDHEIDSQITDVLEAMKKDTPQGDKFPKLLVYLDRLHDMKAKTSRVSVSPDTIALVVGNLLGIILIIAYEQKHVMTSKALAERIRPERHK